ncbi:hypothetical protein FQN53_001347 [Emmonsiellopsis sp. PD_33]|nr:hypothetical protein FQN53_001347 [Emmonsiellopsis sp. PD_33]
MLDDVVKASLAHRQAYLDILHPYDIPILAAYISASVWAIHSPYGLSILMNPSSRVSLDVPSEYRPLYRDRLLADSEETAAVNMPSNQDDFIYQDMYNYPPVHRSPQHSTWYQWRVQRSKWRAYAAPPPESFRSDLGMVVHGARGEPQKLQFSSSGVNPPPPKNERSHKSDPRPKIDPPPSNLVFSIFGNSFPECGSMTDMYRPSYKPYPEASGNEAPQFDLEALRESRTVARLNITKVWKGLSSDKAEELLFWERTFKKVLERLLHDQLELLKQQREIAAHVYPKDDTRGGNISDGVHHLSVSMIDIVTAMVQCFKEHHRPFYWLASKGNMYTTVAQFVRTHDCFVYAHGAVGGPWHGTGGFSVGVKILNPIEHSHAIPPGLVGVPVEVNWAPDCLSFDEFEPVTVEGNQFYLIPRYNSTFTSGIPACVTEERRIRYTTDVPWLRWDKVEEWFTGNVPFYSENEGLTLYPGASIIRGASRDQSQMYALRILVKATIKEEFGRDVIFERSVRSRVTINVRRREYPEVESESLGLAQLFESDSEEGSCREPSPEPGPSNGPVLDTKPYEDPYADPDLDAGEEQILPPDTGNINSVPAEDVPITFPFDLSTDEDEWVSPLGPFNSSLKVRPLRERRFRPSQRDGEAESADPFMDKPKLGITISPLAKTERRDLPRTDSGLHHEIYHMLEVPSPYDHDGEDLEMAYSPWSKRSPVRGVNDSVQKKGNGYLFQDGRDPANRVLSTTDEDEDDRSYAKKYLGQRESHETPDGSSNPMFQDSFTIDGQRVGFGPPNEPSCYWPWIIGPYEDLLAHNYPNRPARPPAYDSGIGVNTSEDTSALRFSFSHPAVEEHLIRGEDKAAFVRDMMEWDRQGRLLASDVGDLCPSSVANTFDWCGTDDGENALGESGYEQDDEGGTESDEGVLLAVDGAVQGAGT